jgi:hypothetical protein
MSKLNRSARISVNKPAASLRPMENSASRALRAADSDVAAGEGAFSAAVEEARWSDVAVCDNIR